MSSRGSKGTLGSPWGPPVVVPGAAWGALGDLLWSSWVPFGDLGAPWRCLWGPKTKTMKKTLVSSWF